MNRIRWMIGHNPLLSFTTALVLGFLVGTGSGGPAETTGALDQTGDLESQVAKLQTDRSQLKGRLASLEDDNAALATQVSKLKAKTREARSSAEAAETEAANNAPGIEVDYAQWEGLFQFTNATIDYSYGYASVLGQLEYLGGGDCELSYVEVDATFFSGGALIGTGLWNTTSLTEGSAVPVEISGETDSVPDRAEIVMTDASC